MKNRELFHRTFDSLPVPENLAGRAAETARPVRRMPRRVLCTAIVAAALIAALSVCAAAGFLGGRNEFVDLCNDELDELRALGLFRMQFELTEDVNIDRGDYYRTSHSGKEYTGQVKVYGGDASAYCHLYMDADAKKITGMSITARPREDWEGRLSATGGFYVYDNYDAIIDPDMTIGEYCEIWRQYQGCERYELPEGVSPETRLLDADTLDAWSFTLEGNGICVPFYRDGSDEPEPVWISYGETGTGPVMTFGNASLKG